MKTVPHKRDCPHVRYQRVTAVYVADLVFRVVCTLCHAATPGGDVTEQRTSSAAGANSTSRFVFTRPPSTANFLLLLISVQNVSLISLTSAAGLNNNNVFKFVCAVPTIGKHGPLHESKKKKPHSKTRTTLTSGTEPTAPSVTGITLS